MMDKYYGTALRTDVPSLLTSRGLGIIAVDWNLYRQMEAKVEAQAMATAPVGLPAAVVGS